MRAGWLTRSHTVQCWREPNCLHPVLQAAGQQGNTAPPPPEQDVDLHFIAFVEHNGEAQHHSSMHSAVLAVTLRTTTSCFVAPMPPVVRQQQLCPQDAGALMTC